MNTGKRYRAFIEREYLHFGNFEHPKNSPNLPFRAQQVCQQFPEARNGALVELCDRELGALEGDGARPAIAITLSDAEKQELAARLNELYGIVPNVPE